MITYETKIKRLEVEPLLDGLTDAVTNIFYECTATNDENGKTFKQQGRCKSPEATTGEYVAYTDLTEEIVLGWIENNQDFIRIKEMSTRMVTPPPAPIRTAEIRTTLPWNK